MGLKKNIKNGLISAYSRQKWLVVFLPVFVFGALIFTASVDRSANASLLKQKAQSQEVFAALSGFEPGAIVTYSIISEGNDATQTTSMVDRHGYLNIPMPENLKNANSDIVYDFSVSEENRTLSLLFKIDAGTGSVSVKGEGSDPFADIEIQASGRNVGTRSDWAGLFEETGISGAPEEGADNFVRVAFYSRDIASDARDHQSPAVIKVLSAPGGGDLNGSNLNQFTETNCSPYPLSTCTTASVNQQNNNIVQNYIMALMLMADQLSAVAMQPVHMIGSFLDAKDQMEVQRKHQELKAVAVKDYHPSEQMCRIGSYARSLAAVEEKSIHDQIVLNDVLMETAENRRNMGTALGAESDIKNRLQQFKRIYCDPNDNNKALELLCDHGAAQPGAANQARMNKDIDYARTVELPYTLDIDFTNDVLSDEETDVVALGRNLYWTDAFSFVSEERLQENAEYLQRSRQHMALNNLAHSSYSKLISMKARSPAAPAGVEPGWAYMKTMLRSLIRGANAAAIDTNIENMFGENPSYHAQMEVLTKKIYQNPDFYTNLYDKPANIDRINASLEAISLMQQRDHYEAALRHELLLSGMVEQELITDAEKLQGKLLTLK